MQNANQLGVQISAQELGCRHFSPKVTMAQITQINPQFAVCWGIDKEVLVMNKDEEIENLYQVLLFKVNANHWKKYVAITLNFGDLYDIHLVDMDMNVVEQVATDIFADTLSYVIDKRIERVPEYKI